jgi:prephenate dehydratase
MDLVAIQGVKGSYSEEAAQRILGDGANILECSDFEQTFAEISSRHANYGVVPFRNKIVGDIEIPHNLLKKHGLNILDKLDLEVRHILVGAQNAKFENLISVRSHVEALKQCKRFFSQHPLLDQVIGADTASSVKRIVEENNALNGAIGSRRAAEIYGAKILKENIADDFDNWTTFYLIGN